MRHRYTQALHPLLRVFTILRLQDERLVTGEDLEGLGNVARAA